MRARRMSRAAAASAIAAVSIVLGGCLASQPPASDADATSSAESAIDGTYRAVHTVPECPDFEPSPGEENRLDEMTFEGGDATFSFYLGHVGSEPVGERVFDFRSTYEVFKDKLTLTHGPESITMTWVIEGDRLVITDVQGGCIDAWVLTSKPWTKVGP